MHNQAILIGHLGQDPEIHQKDEGAMLAVVSLATNREWKDDQGEKKEEVQWHRVVFFGKLAGVVKEHLKQGALIFVEGRIHTRKWQDEEGHDRHGAEIIAQELRMLKRPPAKSDAGDR
jgi:single-strand DNA-binding protein